MHLKRGSHEATLHTIRQQAQLPAREQAGIKLAMRITCSNEKDGHSASSTLVHDSTSQR
jgi:hypothetical protein